MGAPGIWGSLLGLPYVGKLPHVAESTARRPSAPSQPADVTKQCGCGFRAYVRKWDLGTRAYVARQCGSWFKVRGVQKCARALASNEIFGAFLKNDARAFF